MPESTVSDPSARVDEAALARVRSRLLTPPLATPWLHEEAARRMAGRLPLVKLQPSKLLDWSGPLGGSTALLRAAYPRAQLLAVADDGPVEPQPRRLRWWPSAWSGRAVPEPVRPEAVPVGAVELLWSNMALHAHADVPALFERWHAALAVGGFLMFSTLGPGTLAELRHLYRQRGWPEPMAALVDMHDLGDALVHAGFADPVMDQETLTLSWRDAAQALAELRSLGGNVSLRRHPGLRTPRWRQGLLDMLVALGTDGKPTLSFELVYGHAFRVASRARVQAETTVSLADMRAQVRRPGRDPA